MIYRLASYYTLERLRIDDPLNAFAVHGAGGIWGVLACSVFSSDYYVATAIPPIDANTTRAGGLLYGNGNMIGAAAIFLVTAICWVGLSSISMFLLLRRLDILRVPDRDVDASNHTPSQSQSGHADRGGNNGAGVSGGNSNATNTPGSNTGSFRGPTREAAGGWREADRGSSPQRGRELQSPGASANFIRLDQRERERREVGLDDSQASSQA